MVSLSDLTEGSWFESEECVEPSTLSSVILQSSMFRGWGKVLRRRAVAHLGAAQAFRRGAVRLIRMTERRNLVLSGKGVDLPPAPGPTVPCASGVCYGSESEGDSEDEPLSRRVAFYPGFQPSTFNAPSSLAESGKEDSSGSEESEFESASEQESAFKSEDEDEVIYLGRESALANFRSQVLLSRWLVPVVTAAEI